VSLLKAFVEWLLRHDTTDAADRLRELATADLQSFEALLGLARLRRFLETYRANRANDDEQFWQKQLTEQSL
jgi:hypothetical protein